VLAPTAGGKTEAAIFPVLSRILTENLKPVAALYVCPIRALLNNQEERLRATRAWSASRSSSGTATSPTREEAFPARAPRTS
jgi:Lhr-like helicase